jgi:hypothetical protein
MKQNQMWVVQLNKQEYLDDSRGLTNTESLTEVVADFIRRYENWKEGDSILIKPTEMTYYG